MKLSFSLMFLLAVLFAPASLAGNLHIKVLNDSKFQIEGKELDSLETRSEIRQTHARDPSLIISLGACSSQEDSLGRFVKKVRKITELKEITVLAVLKTDCR